jgi:hypothetical protein
MADRDRKLRNAKRLRELANLLESRVYATLRTTEFFDVEMTLKVRDGVIQEDLDVHVRYKEKLSDDRQ